MSSKKGNDDSDLLSELSREPTQADEFDPLVGKKVQKYQIVSRVARGGTATVYRATDTVLNREVAFKILHEHLESRREVVERFRNEAKVVASLRHPNVLNIYDFFEFDGRAVLVAEFMPGSTLSHLIKRFRRIPEQFALMITNEILQGLRSAHDKGITHRDIKPANILIHSELGIKVSDFGLAKLINSDDGLTKEGIFIGTPSFSSPEQIEGKPLDQRTDIFSLGLCLYMMVSGTHAFKQKGDTTTTVWFKIVRGTFQGVREINPDLSPDLERILDRALQVKPEKRYQSAKEMIQDIEAVLKRRRLTPYADQLQEFLTRPYGVERVSAGALAKRKWLRLAGAGLGVAGVLVAGIWLFPHLKPYFQRGAEENLPAPVVIEPAAEAPSSEVSAPAEKPVAPRPRPPVPAKAVSLIGAKTQTALVLPINSAVVSPRGENDFALRFSWQGLEEFFLSPRPNLEPTLVRGEFQDKVYDWTNWDEGKFYWKAGDKRGELLIESLAAYRQRNQVERRDLVVSSQFSEVDLQINPLRQQIRLSWEGGPDASTYRLEVASDANFQNILFSGLPLLKSEKIERFWERDQSIFWRVSYLDSSQNVFFIEPVRRINLKLNVSSSYFDILEPRPYDKVEGVLEVRAIGPRQSKMRCSFVEMGRPIDTWKALNVSGGFFRAEFEMRGQDLICEGEKDGVYTFLFIPLES